MRINRVCSSKTEVCIPTEFILQSGLEISLLHSLSVEVLELYAQKRKTKKKRVCKAILLCGVSECQGFYWLQQGFSLCHVSKSHHLLTNKTEEEIFLSAPPQSLHTCLPFLKCLALPTAGSSYDKKSWSLSGNSCNNSWISKWFVKNYVQIFPVFQGALGTESSVETWLTVAQQIWYWVVRTPLFTFSAVGRFYFYLCRVIKCIF